MKGPELSELIDLELQLRADAALSPEELHARDGAIGQRIVAGDLDDRTATLLWLNEIRVPNGPGALAERRRQLVSALLVVLGFTLGGLSVGGWLATGSREPINVVYFWPVFVGSQIALSLSFLIAVVPAKHFRKLPLVGALHELLQFATAAIPRGLARLLQRFHPSSGERWADTVAELRRLDWRPGRLAFWVSIRMNQFFAIAFNIGALTAFVVLPSIDDPAFGWRSRLLDDRQIEATSEIIALPWRALWPEALPSASAIAATRYSSVAERYHPEIDPNGASGKKPWAAWWPFLVASIACYGLAPRLVYLLLAALGVRRALSSYDFDRVDIVRVCERMRRPIVSTFGIGEESSGAWKYEPQESIAFTWPAPSTARALRWVGVDLDDEILAATLGDRFGTRPGAIHRVGEIDRDVDERAMEAIATGSDREGLYVVVESWEPPVGDQLDLLDVVRERGGSKRPILVVLYAMDTDGDLTSPEPRHLRVWERAVRRRGDPQMFVSALIERDEEESP